MSEKRERLVRIEAAAKRKLKKATAEVGRRTSTSRKIAALLAFRRCIGATSGAGNRLSFRLHEIEKKTGANELMWIEVRDKESGASGITTKARGRASGRSLMTCSAC